MYFNTKLQPSNLETVTELEPSDQFMVAAVFRTVDLQPFPLRGTVTAETESLYRVHVLDPDGYDHDLWATKAMSTRPDG